MGATCGASEGGQWGKIKGAVAVECEASCIEPKACTVSIMHRLKMEKGRVEQLFKCQAVFVSASQGGNL